MGSRIKTGLRIIVFLLILCAGTAVVNRFFLPGQDYRSEKLAFYEEPKDSLDVIFVGSSTCLRAVSPMQMFLEHGFQSYSLATALQAPPVSVFVTKETFRRQEPRVMVFEMTSLFHGYDYTEREANLHMSMDPFRLNPDKIRCAVQIGARDDSQNAVDYLLPIARYHDTWKTRTEQDALKQELSFRKGFMPVSASLAVYPDERYMTYTGDTPEADPDALEFYREMLSVCARRNIPAVVVSYPGTSWTMEQHDWLEAFSGEYGAEYLDFNLPEWWERTGLDPLTDFCDPNHVCTTGAEKISRALGDYLAENYDLPDCRTEGSAFYACAEDYTDSVAWCLHTRRDGDLMTIYVTGTEHSEDLSYQWRVVFDGTVIAENTTQTDAVEIPYPGGGTYSISCRILRGDTEIGRAAAWDWTVE